MVQTWSTSNLMSFLSKILKNKKTHFRVKFGARVKIKLIIIFTTIDVIYPIKPGAEFHHIMDPFHLIMNTFHPIMNIFFS